MTTAIDTAIATRTEARTATETAVGTATDIGHGTRDGADAGEALEGLAAPPGEVSRRHLLRRGAAAAIGVVVVDRALQSGRPAPKAGDPLDVGAPTDAPRTVRVVLEAQSVRVSVVGGQSRAVPRHGDQLLLSGVLMLDGRDVGELHGTGVHLVRSGFNAQGRAAGVWHHVLHLDDGTIVGSGAATHDDAPDELAIIGGTGRYARATGTYTARVSARGLGGDATASFDLDMTLPEA